MSTPRLVGRGSSRALGVTLVDGGVNVAVFSTHATRISLCLFDESGCQETARIALPYRSGDVWHGEIAGIGAGQLYGLRADGPYAPEQGHRFNENKLLLDPYARKITGQPIWDDALFGYVRGQDHTSFDTRDSAPFMPKCVVVPPPGRGTRCRVPMEDTILYEAHIKGLTALRRDVDVPGTLSAQTAPPVIDHIKGLGVTSVELLPLQAFVNDRFLVEQGLTNYWGYQTIGFFAPDPRYLSRDCLLYTSPSPRDS